jgi:signal transduction histidine kinase
VIGLRHLPDRWRQFDVTVRDLPLALLIAVASLVPAVNSHGTQLGDVPNRPLDAFAVLVVVLESLPLALRRRWPLLGLALVSIGFAADQLRGYHTLATIALPIALLNAGLHAGRHRRVVMAAASVAYVVLAIVLAEGLAGSLTFYLGLATAWGAGAWLRLSRAAEAEHRRHVAETTRAAERTRIARDLHDVVTHHVTAMVVQAEAARYLTAAPDRLDETLTAITDTGRRAVTDLRHLLDLLNPDHGIAPRTVGDLHELVEQTRRAGQPVEFVEEGGPLEATGSAETTVYRVVQEALTNALKYAHGRRTVVRVVHSAREISVHVTTEQSDPHAASPGGSGRGLAGLRERVTVIGGEFSAAPESGGGFTVAARIPAGSKP